MMGAFGGCFAVRRSCYVPAPAGFLVDDFYSTLAVLRAGYAAINELAAECREDVSDHLPEEFRRKARISAGNFQNLREFRGLLWPPWRGLGFALWSHKVLRWYTPLLLLALLAATAGLVAGRAGWLYDLALAGQLLGPLLLLLLDAGLGSAGVSIDGAGDSSWPAKALACALPTTRCQLPAANYHQFSTSN